MIYRLKDDGRKLIPVRDIESIVISNDQKAVAAFFNFLLNDLISGKVKPRNEYGFDVDFGSHFQVNADMVEEVAAKIVEKAKPRSITDFGFDPIEARKMATANLQSNAKAQAKTFVLMGYLTKEDIANFLADHGIACEWVSSGSPVKQARPQVQPKTIPRKKEAMIRELRCICPNIENDLNNANRNGLRERAKINQHGMWNMAETLRWATERRGGINGDKAKQIVANDPSSELSILIALFTK